MNGCGTVEKPLEQSWWVGDHEGLPKATATDVLFTSRNLGASRCCASPGLLPSNCSSEEEEASQDLNYP